MHTTVTIHETVTVLALSVCVDMYTELLFELVAFSRNHVLYACD